MAARFGTGFLHGAVVMALLLAGLSLAVPQPDRLLPVAAPTPDPEPGPAVAAIEPPPAVAPSPEPSATVSPRTGDAPEATIPAPRPPEVAPPGQAEPLAAEVDLPVGSEFARGGEVLPDLPAPLVPPVAAMTDAPSVMAPAGEPMPMPAPATDAARPEIGDSAPDLPALADSDTAVARPDAVALSGVQADAPEAPILPDGDRVLAALPDPDLPDPEANAGLPVSQAPAADPATDDLPVAAPRPEDQPENQPAIGAVADAPAQPADQPHAADGRALARAGGDIDLSLPPTLAQIPGL